MVAGSKPNQFIDLDPGRSFGQLSKLLVSSGLRASRSLLSSFSILQHFTASSRPVDLPLTKMDAGDKPHKAHRPSGKKKGKEVQSKGYNEKVGRYFWLVTCLESLTRNFLQAFALNSGRRAEKQARRNAERDQTRLHVPMVNRLPEDEPPPVIIAVVGPPGVCFLVAPQVNGLTSLEQVGKTTLVRSLVRRYTKHTLSEVKGPITLVSGKQRRLTLLECNNDLNSMIDIGKIADLVLLMIDASFGFEMVGHIAKRHLTYSHMLTR